MSQLKWYKRDPDAALSGMLMLSLEQRGAYNTIIDLIYASSDRVHDDDRFICGWLRCDPRVWRRIKSELIQAGKITIEDGFIRQKRATSELTRALGRGLAKPQLQPSQPPSWGAQSGEINGLGPSDPENRYFASIEKENKNKRERGDQGAALPAQAPKTASQRGTRIPSDFDPAPEANQVGYDLGMTEQQIGFEFEKFMDHFRAASGSKGVKVDWQATWKNWLRRAADDYRRKTVQGNFGFNGSGRKAY